MICNSVIVRGGGDIASGTIQKLHRSGFKVLVLEVEKPTTIRRNVAFSEAVYDGQVVVEDIEAVLVKNEDEVENAWENGFVPVIIDEKAEYIEIIKPFAVVDAILAKRNLGTNKDMAPVTIGLGPGFNAGVDVDIVVETMRGHNLGRLIFEGYAIENTGVPGEIGGHADDRVMYSENSGKISNIKNIGDIVKAGETIAVIDGMEVPATITGILRGIIRNGFNVTNGLKIADIDPRFDELENCNTISDKARNIGGAVLEAILYLKSKKNIKL